MQILNDNTILVLTEVDLKETLSQDNNYTYIYLGDNITLTSGITINENKDKITIDGTYQSVTYTYTNNNTEEETTIIANNKNSQITIKNINIISSHPYGVIYVKTNIDYINLVVEYQNINFTGIELSYNYYGTTKITSSIINIEETNNVPAQRACDCNNIILNKDTTITSTATTSTVFLMNDAVNSSLTIAPNSKVNITTNKELMNGTNRLNFTISHGAELLLITGNGFALTPYHGTRNFLLEEFASFTFIEKSHQRVPMWNIFGNFKVCKGASLSVINTYMQTPIDNYNIYFKGSNQELILDNPKYINIYTKNANALYTINSVTFTLKFSRINMWTEANDYPNCCNLDDMPILYWYKDIYPAIVKGTFSKDETTITSHNFTADELSLLPDMSNFSFSNRKIITIGMIKTNIHQINTTKDTISGHTQKDATICVEYEDKKLTTTPDENGLFEVKLQSPIEDNTSIKITTNINAIYTERKVSSPFSGELTLLKVTESIPFTTNIISKDPITLSKKENTIITIVDSRQTKTDWKLYINYINPLIEKDSRVLIDSLLYKKFDNTTIKLNTQKQLIYKNTSSSGEVELSNITYSIDKGLLLSPSLNLLKNDDYKTIVIWTIEE